MALRVDLFEVLEGGIVMVWRKHIVSEEDPEKAERVLASRGDNSLRVRFLAQTHRCEQLKHIDTMFTRHPSAILRHGVDHGGRETPATIVVKPWMMENNARLGSEVAATAEEGGAVAGQGQVSFSTWASLEWCARPRIAGQVDLGERVVGATVSGDLCGSGAAGNREFTNCNIDRLVWEFPPARPTAPGRKRHRRSSALAAPGVILQKGWLQVCKCMSERREESAHSAGAPVVRRSGCGDEGRQTSVCGGHWPPQKCGAFDMQKLGCLVHRVATGKARLPVGNARVRVVHRVCHRVGPFLGSIWGPFGPILGSILLIV